MFDTKNLQTLLYSFNDTVNSGKEGYGISLVRTESSVITKEQFVLNFLVYACTCFQNYYASNS